MPRSAHCRRIANSAFLASATKIPVPKDNVSGSMKGEAKVLTALHPLHNCAVQHKVSNMTMPSFKDTMVFELSLFCSD